MNAITETTISDDSLITDETAFNNVSSFNKSEFGVRGFLDVRAGLGDPSFPLVPEKALISYFVCINGIGVVLNLFIMVDFLKRNTNGFHSLLIQMAASDILMLTVVAVPEMWSHSSGSWTLGPAACIVYSGFEVFAGTCGSYFLVALALHAIAVANLALGKFKKEAEEELLEDMTEMKSSRHSLVSRSESSTPTKAADTEKREPSAIPAIFPATLVWILAASLSVPEFALSTTIDVRSGPKICTFADGYYSTSMRVLLFTFQLLIPLAALFVASAVIFYKLRKIAKQKEEQREQSSEELRLALVLCCSYLALNVPRSALSGAHLALGALRGAAAEDGLERFKTPPLNNPHVPAALPFAFSFFHFLASALKPIAYLCFIKNPKRKMFSTFVKYRKSDQEQVL